MKALLFLLLCPFLISHYENKNLDNVNGFEKFKFGTSPGEYQNISLELDEGETKLYDVSTLPTINDTELNYIRLTFTRNKLSAISVATKNGGGTRLMEYLKGLYGSPFQKKNNFEWLGKSVQLIYEPLSNKDATIFMYEKGMTAKK